MTEKHLFIGANWKMNPMPEGCHEVDSPYRATKNHTIVVFPNMLDLDSCIAGKLNVGAQYARSEPAGAFTGDISMKSVKAIGCTHVLCGHSERRTHHHETNAEVAAQVRSALQAGLVPVLCIGENADQREMDETKEVLAEQLMDVSDLSGMIIAYEPVWAVGTGKTPTPADVNATHAFIRSLLKEKKTRILYGGSVTGENAGSFFAEQNIDGALVGGASLKPEEFRKIVEATKR